MSLNLMLFQILILYFKIFIQLKQQGEENSRWSNLKNKQDGKWSLSFEFSRTSFQDVNFTWAYISHLSEEEI